MPALSYSQIKQYAINAGFRGQAADTITAISLAESSGNPYAYNGRDPAGGSYGLTQINGVHHGAITAYGDPQTALNLAYSVSNGGTNFRPWSTYTNGTYETYLSPDTPAASSGGTFLEVTQPAYNPFVSTPNDSGLLSGLPRVPTLDADYGVVSPTFTGSGGELVSGLTTQTGADETTSLPLSPDISSLPGSAENTSVTDAISQTGTGQDLFPGQSGSTSTPFTANTAQTSFYNWAVGIGTDFFIRGGAFLIGAIMLGVAAYAFAREK